MKLNGSVGDLRSRRKVSLQDIYFIESNNKNVIVHTTEGTYEVQGKMDEFQKFFCGRDYELSWTESLFLLPPCVTVLAIDVTLRAMAYSVDNSALMLVYYRVPETLLLLPLVSLLLLGMMITAVRLFHGIVQFKESEAKRLLLENGINDIHRQVEEMQDIYGDMRGLRHDLRGHIESLTAYVHNHLQGEHTQIEGYLAQMTKTTQRLDFADKTGNAKNSQADGTGPGKTHGV